MRVAVVEGREDPGLCVVKVDALDTLGSSKELPFDIETHVADRPSDGVERGSEVIVRRE